ncbi:Asparaginyl-tRNA synthetase [Labilithrix luteola]|uniref:Asparagine--tRNA ligase n=1 Tax=Labilithrix luteola TaxID=1391654 RepID=A0A0K1Q0Z4_9BACT|nr:asparagine--tRNA ligase [Labilithrix luteola]AKU99407.1 Asparaginyl-tRNA synthetase [Labilithrix luteola]
MHVVSVKEALEGKVEVGSKVEVRGWVRTRRDSKAGISFIHVTDGSCQAPIQAVAPNTLGNYQNEVLHLTTGASLIVRGTLVQSQGKGQAFEIQADEVVVLGLVDDPETYPLQPKQHTAEFLREQAHLRPRSNSFGAITRIRHAAAMAIHRFFTEQGFVWVNTPIVTASDAEGAGQMFRVSTLDALKPPRTPEGGVDFGQDFFRKEAYLTVSGQLNVEAYCMAMSKVYTFGPTFRAENSNTTRHLAEFWMIEPEIAFANLSDDAELAEAFLKAIFKAVLNERRDDLAFLDSTVGKGIVTQGGLIARLEAFVQSSFERVDYTDAIEMLKKSKKKFEFAPEWGNDLQTEHERFLAEEHIGRPVVVMNYPEQIKAFYMRMNDDGKTVAAMDVLAPGIGEIIGGSQREERLDMLDARMRKMNLEPEHYGWYRDLRRYGSVPHAGFGLGFERLLVYICGLGNIRDAIPYPRVPGWAQF